jgi:hypothetical protein
VDIQGDRDDLVLTFTADTSDEAQFESPFVYEDF